MAWRLQVVFRKHNRPIAFRVLWMVIAVLLIFGARYWSLYGDAHAKYLRISMKSSVSGVAQIFYDTGQGFTEMSSEQTTVHASNQFREYRFPFPDEKRIFNLRFDPLASVGYVEIHRIDITDGLGNSFLGFDLKQLVPSNQIDRLEMDHDHLTVVMDATADDPQIHIRLNEPLLISQEVHPAYHTELLLSFGVILFSLFLIYLWVAWRDEKNIKKWIYHGLIAVGFTIVVFHCLQTALAILDRSIQPLGGGDTAVFLHMAALEWTNPWFYHGLRPPVVPFLYSLVNGSQNTHNIILLQTIVSFASWLFLASMTSYYLKDYLTKVFAFYLIALIPLNAFMHLSNLIILSESLSFSFLAVFLGAYLWYFHRRSILSVILLAIVALILAFTRDTDAYRVLLLSLPILFLIFHQFRKNAQGVMRHVILLIIFLMIFVGSNVSSSNIQCRDCRSPHMNARWFMPTMNNLFQRILPFEDRVQFYVDHGLPVTPELMAMKYLWASSNDWQAAFDPKLAAQREWNYLHGRQTYMKFLITHPTYMLTSAYENRGVLLYLDGSEKAWFHDMVKPINTKVLSLFFLNNAHDLKVFMVLCPVSLMLILVFYRTRQRKNTEGHLLTIPLIVYIILTTIPIGMLIFHGDIMDLARHSFTNIIQLNVGVVLLYLFTADLLMMRVRKCFSLA